MVRRAFFIRHVFPCDRVSRYLGSVDGPLGELCLNYFKDVTGRDYYS